MELSLGIPFAHRPEDALQLSAVLSHPDASHWLADHYISVYIDEEYLHRPWDGFFDADMIYTCPFLIHHSVSRATLKNLGISIERYFISILQEQNYIFCCVNKFYIPHYPDYHTQKRAHYIIVYGYDEEKQLFLTADFINGKFERFTCDPFSLEQGIFFCTLGNFELLDKHTNSEVLTHYFDAIFFLKNDQKISYKFNKALLLDSLQCYVEGRKPQGLDYIPYGKNTYEFAFGISILEVCKNIIGESRLMNIKPFYLMKMHKLLMKQRLVYLRDHKYMDNIEEYLLCNNQLQQLYTTLYLLVLKYNMTSWKSEGTKRLIELIQKAESLELRNTAAIISHIHNNA